MNLLGRTQMMDIPFEESILFFIKNGFDGAEISMSNKSFEPRPEFFQKGFGKKMRAFLSDNEISAYSVSAHCDYTASETIFDRVLYSIEIAHEINAPAVIINGAFKNGNYSKMLECTGLLCEKSGGMKLALEFEPGFLIDNTASMLKFFSEIGLPALGANLDIGHMFLCDPDPIAAIASCKGKIFHCHIENMKKGVHNHLVPYEGDMNLTDYLSALMDAGFDGSMALDLYQYDYAAVARPSAEYIKNLIKSLREN